MRKLALFLLILVTCGAVNAQQNKALSTASGTCAPNTTSCLLVSVDQTQGGATLTVTANASGNTISFVGSGDGGQSWVALNATPSNSSTAASSTTGTGTWQVNTAGYTNIGMLLSTLVSGTTTVSIIQSTASARSGSGGGGGGGGLVAPFSQFGTNPAFLGTQGNDNAGFKVTNVAGTDAAALYETGGFGDLNLSNSTTNASFDVNTNPGNATGVVETLTVFGGGESLFYPGYSDSGTLASPGNPVSGFDRVYFDSTTGNLTCLTSAGVNCIIPGATIPSDGSLSLINYIKADSSNNGEGLAAYFKDFDVSTNGTIETLTALSSMTDNAASTVQAISGIFNAGLEGSNVAGDSAIAATFQYNSGAAAGAPAETTAIKILSGTVDATGSVIQSGIHILDQAQDSQATTTNAAILIEDQTPGSTVYAIKTGAGLVSFGDSLAPHTVIVSALPAAAAGNKGYMLVVSDSTTVVAEGQTCVGSGSATALAFSNGTVWKCF